ncbi:MAG: diguanylate cyclase [Clostridia bacterium]
MKNRRLPSPIIAISAFTLIVLFSLLGYYIDTKRETVKQAYTTLAESAAYQATAFTSKLNGQYYVLESYAKLLNAPFQNNQNIIHEMSAIALSGDFTYVSFADKSGNALSNIATTFDVSNTHFFKDSILGRRGFEYTKHGLINDVVRFTISVPVRHGNNIEGIIMASYDDSNFNDLLISQAYNRESFSFVVDSLGNTVIGSNSKNFWSEWSNVLDLYGRAQLSDGISLEHIRQDFANGRPNTFHFIYNGNARYVSYMPLGINDWNIICVAPGDLVDARASAATNRMLMLSVELLLASALLIVYIILRDRFKTKQLLNEKELLRRSEERYRLIEELSDSVIFDGDLSADTIHYNQSFKRVIGRMPLSFKISQLETPDDSIYDKDRPIVKELSSAFMRGVPKAAAEFRMLDATGRYNWYRMEGVTLYDADNKPYRVLGKLSNVNNEVQRLQQLESKAESDSLTGLLNRETACTKIDDFLLTDGRNARHAFMLIDIDNFKSVNDTLGHFEGDRTLIALSLEMKRLFRGTDIIARLGGDEFVAFIKNVASDEPICLKARELCDAMEFVHTAEGGELHISCSAGIAIYGSDGTNFEQLYKCADSALYEAKKQGKGRYLFYGGESTSHSGTIPLPSGSSAIQLHALLDNIDGGIGLFEFNKSTIRSLYLNPGYYSLAGYTCAERPGPGDDILSRLSETDALHMCDLLSEALANNDVMDHTFPVIRCNGSIGWWHIRAVQIPYNSSNALPVFIAVIMDVTAHKQTEEELEKTSLKLQALINSVPGGIGIFEIGDTIKAQYANDGMLLLTGYSREELSCITGNFTMALVHPDDLPALIDAISNAVEKRQLMEHSFRLMTASGECRWVLARASRIDTYEDKPVLFAMLMDITKEKALEQELRTGEERLQIAFEQTAASIWELDIATRISYQSDSSMKEFGLESSVIHNSPECFVESGLVHPDSVNEFMALYERIYRGDRQSSCIAKLRLANGQYCRMRISFRNIFDEFGVPNRAIGIAEAIGISELRALA